MIGDNAIARLRLARTRTVGPITYRQLIGRFGTAEAALDALPDLARRGGRSIAVAATDAVAREMASVAAVGGRYLFIDTPDYPAALAELPNAPIALICVGDIALLERPCVAMVGARNASAAACRFARQLSADLGAQEHIVVSGLARGIDTAAHVGALANGTIAVIASGHDVTFPPENAKLQAEIGANHLLISEYAPGTQPLARQFPHRNRIIAGLAAGTIVVEAAPRSGSLLTARMAAEAGREVMAVPGSPLDPRAQGCNALIRDGATLIQNVDDVLESLRSIDPRMVRSQSSFVAAPAAELSDIARNQLFDLLGPTPISVDELVRQSDHSPAEVAVALMEWELAGRIEHHAGGKVALV